VTIPDPGATPSWQRVQYRGVLLTSDDLAHARAAIASVPSKAYALLVPPPPLAPPVCTPNALGTTATVTLIRVDTTAQRLTTDVGDHTLSLVVKDATPPVRFSSALEQLQIFPSETALAASTEKAGYVQTGAVYTLYLRLDRAAGQQLTVVLDIADPLARAVHVTLTVPFENPDPSPQLASLTLTRAAGVVFGSFIANTPSPPDPAHKWQLAISAAPLFPPAPPQTRTFDPATISTIASAAAMPKPVFPTQLFAMAQVAGTTPRQWMFWIRSASALAIQVKLTNALGLSATIQKVSP
jgi:hypothetical protein